MAPSTLVILVFASRCFALIPRQSTKRSCVDVRSIHAIPPGMPTDEGTFSAYEALKTISPASPRVKRGWLGGELPTDEEAWREVLSVDQFEVLRDKVTEPPGYSADTPGQLEYELLASFKTKYPQVGGYRCTGCGASLYYAKTKFGAGCGWPAFYEGVLDAVREQPDNEDLHEGKGVSVEILCKKCDGHLGHIFRGEGYPTPTDARHCVNGLCLEYDPGMEQPDSVSAVPKYLTLGEIPL